MLNNEFEDLIPPHDLELIKTTALVTMAQCSCGCWSQSSDKEPDLEGAHFVHEQYEIDKWKRRLFRWLMDNPVRDDNEAY